MKLHTLLMTMAVTLFAANASAQYGFDSYGSGNDQGCGPDINATYNNGAAGGGFNSFGSGGGADDSYSVGITWKLDSGCKERQANKRRKDRAQAEQAAIKTLNEKIAVCSRFDPMNAPQSIRNFCGDLVGVQLRAGTPVQKSYTPYTPN